MEFIKKINNNVACVKDKENIEYIVLGKGIGFSAKSGEKVDESMIDRRYILEDSNNSHQNVQILSEMPPEIIDVTSKITLMIKEELGIEFNNVNYLILADHIKFAVKRQSEGIEYPILNHWELRKIHPEEFQAAKKALLMINNTLGSSLNESEVEFLTNHFVNAANNHSTINQTVKVIQLIKKIVKLVEYQYQITLDSNLFAHGKFINHLRYFILCKLYSQTQEEHLDEEFLQMYRAKYPYEYRMSQKIADFLYVKEGWTVSEEEKIYLTIHCKRIKNVQLSKF